MSLEMSCPSCASDSADVVAQYSGTAEIFRRMNLSRCVRCGMLYAQPQPDQAELAQYYGRYWGGDVAISTPSTRRYYLAQGVSRVRYIERWCSIDSRIDVLDVGAGLGLFHEALEHTGADARYVAVETDRTQLAGLRARFGKGAAHEDLAELPAGDAFDLIVLAHVLEHMPRPHDFLDAVVKHLKPGGILFVEVPNGDHRYKANFEPHLLFFTPDTLQTLLGKHGEVLDVSTVGKPVSALHITRSRPARGALRPAIEMIKSLIAGVTPNIVEQQIRRFEMTGYGEDRQWLRAVVRRRPE